MMESRDLNQDNIYKPNYSMLNFNVLESMADWVRVVDNKGTILYANNAMKKDLGQALVGKLCYEAYCKEKRCEFCISTRSLITGETIQKEELINGRYYSIKSSPVADVDGNVYAAVEVFRDITRERKLELELIDRNKKIRRDLQFAKRIQERMLPKKGVVENIKIDYIYKPSEMLSGDMFDIFYIDEENIGVYISDVAGHGIGASIMTMFIRQTMRGIIGDILSPTLVLTELHRRFQLLNLEPDKYFTMFYGIYNKVTHEFKYANAGHNCIPIKFNDHGYELLNMSGYPVSSLFNEIIYKEKKTKLSKDDRMLFYTDGITEATDHFGEEFGVEGILDTIKNNPYNILEKIEDKFIYHSWGEQNDDYALVLIEIIK